MSNWSLSSPEIRLFDVIWNLRLIHSHPSTCDTNLLPSEKLMEGMIGVRRIVSEYCNQGLIFEGGDVLFYRSRTWASSTWQSPVSGQRSHLRGIEDVSWRRESWRSLASSSVEIGLRSEDGSSLAQRHRTNGLLKEWIFEIHILRVFYRCQGKREVLQILDYFYIWSIET